jgi:hypothetical protein
MENVKDFLIGTLIGVIISIIVVYGFELLGSIILFEDGSFTGCLPFAICNLP